MGWWRYRIPGLGEVDFRRYVDALYEGGFEGVLSVEHEDPVWGGTPEMVERASRSPSATCVRWWSADGRRATDRSSRSGTWSRSTRG